MSKLKENAQKIHEALVDGLAALLEENNKNPETIRLTLQFLKQNGISVELEGTEDADRLKAALSKDDPDFQEFEGGLRAIS